MSVPPDSVEELTLTFAGLQISIRRAPSSSTAAEAGVGLAESREDLSADLLPSPPTTSSQTVTGPLAGEASSQPPRDRAGGLSSAEEELLRAETVGELVQFDLGANRHLARTLGAVGDWTPEARIARAVRTGIGGYLVLTRVRARPARSPPVPELRNRCYIVLRCAAYPSGFYTERLGTFRRFVPQDQQGRLEADSISHAFASRSEAVAYIYGARAAWPVEL